MARHVDHFTTGQIADFCGVAARTVGKWIDSGRLKGWRIPGSLDRRVYLATLRVFMEQHGMDTSMLPARKGVVVAVGFGAEKLPDGCGFEVHYVKTAFDAGAAFATHKPDAVLVDTAIGRIDAALISNSVRPTALCVAVGEDGVFDAFDAVIPPHLSPIDKAVRLRIVIEAGGETKAKKAS